MSDDTNLDPMQPVEGEMGTDEGTGVEKKPLEDGEEGEGSTMPEGEEEASAE